MVTVFIPTEKDAASMIAWGVRFAQADNSNLQVIIPRKSKGKEAFQRIGRPGEETENNIHVKAFEAIDTVLCDNVLLASPPSSQPKKSIGDTLKDENPDSMMFADSSSDKVVIRVKEIVSPTPGKAMFEQLGDLDTSLLMLPAREPVKSQTENEDWLKKIWEHSQCDTMLLRDNFPPKHKKLRILVATQGETDTDTALRRAFELAKQSEGEVSLLFVRPDDDEVAEQVARLQLKRLSRNLNISILDVPQSIRLGDNLHSAIQKHCEAQGDAFDLVLAGTRREKTLRQLLRSPDITASEYCALATIREGVPLSTRVWNKTTDWVRGKIPQLNRELRVSLVDRLQMSSEFNFDFIALISLSTLIAGLGLVRNSAAVVIGAMLIAPLMTPLAGMGFALVQGNEKLVKIAAKSVIFGFAVAYLIAILTGVLVPLEAMAPEMIARGAPNLLDLLVALASGVAAAYAMGRPGLFSALPGVAIAAALVPPIATSGIALAHFSMDYNAGMNAGWQLALGSLLLFLTNIVAIVLGTAITFWAIGVDARSASKKSEGKSNPAWPRILFAFFVLLSVLLAAIVSSQIGIAPIRQPSETTEEAKEEVNQAKEEAKDDLRLEIEKLKEEIKQIKEEAKQEIKEETKDEIKQEIKEETKDEIKEEIKEEIENSPPLVAPAGGEPSSQ